ncbi:MAG: KUP/HAK/KT family potassium transporter [Bacteroidales bacterium]|nr:KUP/HAK/KT family potassium transporter [Bacteroidales bacterium]
MDTNSASNFDKLKISGLIITIGIVYGDLGTSPLYTIQAIMTATNKIDEMFVLGALSCVFWTIMLESTLKYVFITLKASNKGERGIFSLFTMVRNKVKWAFLVAIIGACALLADGVITPAITVTSSMEGLQIFDASLPVVGLVIIILTGIFLIQPFGTKKIGSLFGPVMLIWFLMLLILGLIQLIKYPEVLKAVNPYYAIHTIIHNPDILKLLGAVFLCTTGAEALYSDLGHVGIKNIRMTWILVSTSLITNYFGQGAWILSQKETVTAATNPFFSIMPGWFLIFGVIIATLAAIIASQALISGSYTIISEAISLNFFPKLQINYPTNLKRQMYIPKVNWLLYFCALFVVVYFRNSTSMESAYGLSISFAMICTSILLVLYIWDKIPRWASIGYIILYGIIELGFLTANMTKFFTGGWVTILLSVLYISIMYSWANGGKIAQKFILFRDIRRYIPVLKGMQSDETLPIYSSNLVYITDSTEPVKIENTILYSILRKPKKSNIYWFIHTTTANDPHTLTYQIFEIEPGLIYRINMNFGFKEVRKVNLYFNEILMDMIKENKFSNISPHPSLKANKILTDLSFIVIDNIQNKDYSFSMKEQLLMNYYFICKKYLVKEISYLGLDQTITQTEKIPLMSATDISITTENEKNVLATNTNLDINISGTEKIERV